MGKQLKKIQQKYIPPKKCFFFKKAAIQKREKEKKETEKVSECIFR
jgi:hypothetical protein